jgi:hypothetical protein
VRVVVGERGLSGGKVEIKRRTDAKASEVPAGEAVGEVLDILARLKGA